MAGVTYDAVTRRYPGSPRAAVDALDLEIADGEFLVLVGPSGCGKTTSLRMLAGLEDIDGGRIRIGDRDVTGVAPKERDIAMVFQNYALYPHMSVADNMGFALKIAGTPKAEIARRVAEAARILDLEQYLDRKPKALSEGAVRRPAPAGRHGPRDRAPAAGVPDGRAAVQPGRQAARPDPHPDRVAAAAARRHHRLRHPRPGRGHDDGGPGRRPEGRAAAPVRPAR
ncbi:Glycerol-3-phosphate ABC transporter, ATP-binding protein UgpC [Pseudonocardia sp. Ae168_Ps1]|nr:Glycerol-3-phosphate ABC transporter, ATP-binding protein UgpC [Pseudonocardia sp. Ae168_Ps1]OLL77469.1 Glycerol-3-phosphate ABC transporter, ATP-binding protein UgpC [Pseudonocardia sp. Ae150A_Ps1]OLL88418.1 Glycerol-3-phosphate ABC transporter, ATP-binding protein UgpC [Pseudonocardia sp. Ae263_Ps1]OLL91559.1 Glycerol-3-phosphate ABC transporter, ATP-binding protein UgpC [Pseudonocardia sp. Ae356_Ps1]